MKKQIILLLGVVFTVSILTSCFKSDHFLRIKNSYSRSFTDVRINSTSYGRIAAGETTTYKPIEEGNFSIYGTTVNGEALSGSGTIKGKGTHNWTITITAAGGVTMAEDK